MQTNYLVKNKQYKHGRCGMIVNETAIHQKTDKNLNFYRSHNGLQQWTGIHTAKQAVKGPEKYNMCQYS